MIPIRFAAWVGVLLLPLLLLVGGCDRYPQDPARTLDRALERGTLRVGVLDRPPWSIAEEGSPPAGVEPALLADFAANLGLDIDWHHGAAPELFEALARYDLDVVIGGLTDDNPWHAHVAFTMPYYTTDTNDHHVMAVAAGENAMLMELEQFLAGINHDAINVRLQQTVQP